MERKYPHLSSPITLGRVTFRNRMFSTPMGGTDITNDGCIGLKSTAFYELRAKGGAGAVTVSELMVHPKTDASHAYHLDESILNSLSCATYTADAIRRHGAIPSIELSHSGMYAGTYMTDKDRQKSISQWSASDGVRPDAVPVKALTKEMIGEITGEPKETTVIFGDRLYTDIATGKRHGITAALVLTGETTREDVENAREDERPDLLLSSLADADRLMFGDGCEQNPLYG